MVHPSVKGWNNGWKSFGDVLLPLQGDFPEIIALMRYLVGMVSTDHSGAPAKAQATGSLERDILGAGRKERIDRKDEKSILFIPLFSRAYCLGSCLKVAGELYRQKPGISVLMLEPQGEVRDLPSYLEVISISALRKGGLFQLPGAVFSGSLLWGAVCKVLGREVLLGDEMTRVFGNWRSHLLRWCCLYHFDQRIARKLLMKRGVRSVVTINDVVKPAAPVVSAANKLGLQTVVLQHGTPGPQSAPFMAKEGWVWGETSKRAFEIFGADPSRLKIMGGLEVDDVPVLERTAKNGPRTLVFLGQWRATRGWGERFFQEVFDLLKVTLEERPGEWQLRVRLHPTDPAEAREDIFSRLKSSLIKVTLSEDGKSMEDEFKDADALLSVNSSGLMNGVSRGLPTAQILPTELEEKVGPALLDTTNLLRDRAALESWLDLVEENSFTLQASTAQILANRGKVAELMAAQLA